MSSRKILYIYIVSNKYIGLNYIERHASLPMAPFFLGVSRVDFLLTNYGIVLVGFFHFSFFSWVLIISFKVFFFFLSLIFFLVTLFYPTTKGTLKFCFIFSLSSTNM